jgi:hypothetical protein
MRIAWMSSVRTLAHVSVYFCCERYANDFGCIGEFLKVENDKPLHIAVQALGSNMVNRGFQLPLEVSSMRASFLSISVELRRM